MNAIALQKLTLDWVEHEKSDKSELCHAGIVLKSVVTVRRN